MTERQLEEFTMNYFRCKFEGIERGCACDVEAFYERLNFAKALMKELKHLQK